MSNNKLQIGKVLFVASGNKQVGTVSAFVQSQFDSLQMVGLDMHMMPVIGHGLNAYLRNAQELRQLIRKEKPDVIHAHYSLCGWVATLACMGLSHKPKIVVSILGSFPKRNNKWRFVRFSVKHLWDKTIVKSERTRNQLGLDLLVIPNGVNLDIFHPMDQIETRKQVGFETIKPKYVIWCSNPYNRPEKNWPLAETAVESARCKVEGVELVAVFDKTPQEVAAYMNAADCLLLTSDSEGSPNVIKEAMACNCPIVTTNVGDVTERLRDLDGCYVVDSHQPEPLADAIIQALAFNRRTAGYERILADRLEISQIAKRLIEVYEQI